MTSTDTAGQVEARAYEDATIADLAGAIGGHSPDFVHPVLQSTLELLIRRATALPADRLACGGGDVEARLFIRDDEDPAKYDALLAQASAANELEKLIEQLDHTTSEDYLPEPSTLRDVLAFLRKLAARQSPAPATQAAGGGEVEALRKRITDLFRAGDFHNGVEHAGMDEGDIKSGQMLDEILADLTGLMPVTAVMIGEVSDAVRAASDELSNLLFNQAGPRTYTIIDKLDALHKRCAALATLSPAPKVQTAGDEGGRLQDDREYAVGALRGGLSLLNDGNLDAAKAVLQAGLDLATLGAEACAEMRGDAALQGKTQ